MQRLARLTQFGQRVGVERGGRHSENLRRRAVHGAHPQRLVEHHHAGRQVGQHALQKGLGLFGLLVVLRHLFARIGQLARHAVERLDQHAQFVAAVHRRHLRKIALGHGAGAARQRAQRRAEALRQQVGNDERHQQRQHQGQRQRHPVDALQAQPRHSDLLVFLIGQLHRLRIARQAGGHRLHQLQHARFAGQRAGIHRHDDAHDEPAIGHLLDPAVGLLLAHLPQHVALGQHRQQGAALAADVGDDAAAFVEQGHFLHRALLAQGRQAGDDGTQAFVRQEQRHALRFFVQFAQEVVERGMAEIDAGGQRVVDPHVEPGFDRAVEKKHRGAIHHQAGQQGDDAEHQQQFERELGAEHAAADAFLQPPQAPAQQRQQRHAEHAAADE